MARRMVKAVGLLVMGLGLMGCGGGRVAYRAPYPPPPPPPGYGMRAPGPGYVWVESHRDWRGGRWVMVPGSWMRPPHGRAVWRQGYFRGQGRGKVWMRPGWY